MRDYSALVYQPDPLMGVVILETNFGLKLRYEIDTEIFWLACDACSKRLVNLTNQPDLICEDCRITYPQYTGNSTIAMARWKFLSIVEGWVFRLVDPIEIPTATTETVRLMKDVSRSLMDDDAEIPSFTDEEIEKVCRRYTGPMSF